MYARTSLVRKMWPLLPPPMRDGTARAALVMERLNLRKVSELYSTLGMGTMTAFLAAASAVARVAMLVAVLMAVLVAVTVAMAAAAAAVVVLAFQ